MLRFAVDSVLCYCVPMNQRAFTLRPSVLIIVIIIVVIVIGPEPGPLLLEKIHRPAMKERVCALEEGLGVTGLIGDYRYL